MENITKKISVKDLVLIGILSAIIAIIYLVAGMITGMSAAANPFYPILAAIPNGILYMLLLAKVPKKGAFTISGVVQGVLLLLVGAFWTLPVATMIIGLICDFLIIGNKAMNYKRMLTAYVVAVAGYTLGAIGPIVLLRDAFVAICEKNGVPQAYIDTLMSVTSGFMLIVIIAAAAAAALTGGVLGQKILKKHFIRAGVVEAAK